ncbi:MAG: transcriptional repressor [Planctomycetes bacterium]|nr:transcriptional repressor [Planctomycetota bacterium]
MKHDAIRKSFERFLRGRELKLTPQRRRVFERAFATHEHFSAEEFYAWLRAEPGPKVSRATVYRTLGLLLEGGFIQSLDAGRGELIYEHVVGHRHHDHMVCLACGKIEEFHDERIEALQHEACAKKGFQIVSHAHRLVGYCRGCARKLPLEDEAARGDDTGAGTSATSAQAEAALEDQRD